MKLLHHHDFDARGIVYTYRNRSWRNLLWVALVMFGIAGYVALPKIGPTNPVLIAVPVLAGALFLLLALLRLRVCRHRANWLLHEANDGLYVHIRSFLNHHLPEDAPTVLFIEYSAIEGFCKCIEERVVPSNHGHSRDRFSCLDFVLTGVPNEELAILAAALYVERRAQAHPGLLAPAKRHDYPVRLIAPPEAGGPAVLRLVWDQVHPHEEAAAARLSALLPRFPDARHKLPRWESLDDAGQEAFIAQLWEWGDVEDAARLVRIRHKVGATGVRAYFKEHFEQG